MKRQQLPQDVSGDFQLLTVGEAADSLRLSVRSVYRLLSSGELRSVRIGSRRFVPVEELRWLVARSHQHDPRT